MSTRPTRAAPAPSGVVRQLLVLQPYHCAYLGAVLALTLGGLGISLLWGTHLQNLATTVPPVPQQEKGYWANKHNVFNQVFVKYAMVWNWLVFVLQLVALKTTRLAYFTALPANKLSSPTLPNEYYGTEEPIALVASSSAPSPPAEAAERNAASKANNDAPVPVPVPASASAITSVSLVSMSLIRFVAATVIWLLFASWFFGPSIMYRVLVATGGTCVPVQPPDVVGTLGFLPATVDHSYCAQRRPFTVPPGENAGASNLTHHKLRTEWRGGHDMSGHTFLLILSLLWMLEEVSPLIPYLLPFPSLARLYPRTQWWPFNYRGSTTTGIAGLPPPRARGYTVGLVATLTLAGLWAWMLLQTQIYYHTPAEKISGLVAGVAAWLLLPKGS